MRSRLDVAAATGLTPLVGRQQELGLLEDRWQQATEGRGQAVLICGEAGIGKSRLLQAFRERIADRSHTWLECRGSLYTQDSAFYPVLEIQRVALGFTAEMTGAEKLARLEDGLTAAGFELATAAPVLARFQTLSIPEDRYRDPALSPEVLRKKTIALLVEWLLRLGRQQPAILLVEDLHWMDPSTLELLGQVLEQLPAERLLLLLTYRPDFEPLWGARSHLTPMLLSRLARGQLADLIRKAARGRDLPEAWVEEVVRRSDGVPFFAEELTRAVIETSGASEAGATPEPRIPATLQDSLMARLDALGPAKELAQLASVLGREFDYALLLAVSSMKEAELQVALAATVRAELFYQRGTPPEATYVFKHALIRDAAYESMLRSTRRRHHRRVAETLIECMPHLAEVQPELVAHHHTEAGQTRPAIDKWHEAGRRSLQRSANKEASAHLKRALELLATQPHSPERDHEELDLQIELGSATTMMSQGWESPEGARCFARARELCLAVGDERERFPILWGFWQIHQTRSELTEMRESAAELLAIAERHRDPAMLVQAHHANWGNPGRGDFASQLEHVERGLSHYDPAEHSRLAPQYGGHDAGVCGHCHRGVALFATGYPERSGASFAAALALADEIAHPQSKVHALALSGWLPAMRSDWPEAFRAADAALALSSELGVPTWISMAAVMRGWALVGLGEAADGLAQIRRSLESGGHMFFASHQAFYAEALHLAGETEKALATLHDALPLMERSGQGLWKANAMALKGDLLLARGLHDDAELCYRTAIEVARAQAAKMWELRAATRLARLWHLQGKTIEARDLLAPIYGWFTEGFDTKDLKDAKALLEELA
jgi:tetratricopeptide (TPR) repeat protein